MSRGQANYKRTIAAGCLQKEVPYEMRSSMMPQAMRAPVLSWITTVRPRRSLRPRPVSTSTKRTFAGSVLESYLTDSQGSSPSPSQ